jgi:hypothetical protein
MKEVFIAGMVVSGGLFATIILKSLDRYDETGLTPDVIGLWILAAVLALGYIISMKLAIREARKEETIVKPIVPETPRQIKKLKWYQKFALWFYKVALALYRKAGLDAIKE